MSVASPASLKLGLNNHLMDVAFPFYFAVDPDLRIVRLGVQLQRILPVMGALLSDIFVVEAPRTRLTVTELAQHSHSIFLLRARQSQLLLRGQFIQAEEPGYLLFLGSPGITDLSELLALGLSLDDFAIHDVVADFLVVVQAKNNTLNELNEVAVDLARQRSELKSANRQLTVQRQVGQVLSGATDMRSVAGALLSAIGGPLGLTRGAVWDLGPKIPFCIAKFGNFVANEPSQVVADAQPLLAWERTGNSISRLAMKIPADLVLEWGVERPIPYDPSYEALLKEVAAELSQAEEQWRTERQLSETESRRAAIMGASLDAILTTDNYWQILEINPSAQTLLGWGTEEAVGRRVDELLVPPARVRDRPTTMSDSRFEQYVITRDGREFPAEVSVVPTGKDDVPGYILFLRDLTHHKMAEAALTDAAAAALAASKAKSDFLAHFSHELRTPMNAILGMADIAQESTSMAEISECLVRIQRNGEAMREHISGILDISKIEAGEMDLEERDFDLLDLVEGVVESLALRADQKEMQLYCLIDPKVPQRIRGDRHRLRQVLINLVGNAIKFTNRGEVRVEVTTEPGPLLHFAVHDTGIGLSESDLRQISQKFWRSERAKGYMGTGLGLSITRSIVDRLQGNIQIESELGVGTCFHVRLPLTVAPSLPKVPFPNPMPRIQVQLSHLRSAQNVIDTLRSRGFQIAREFEVPDLLICEVDQPAGIERALQAQARGALVIGVTALGKGLPGRERLNGQLHNPFGPHRVMQRIEQLFGQTTPQETEPRQKSNRPYRILVVEDIVDNQKIFVHTLRRAGYEVEIANHGGEALERVTTCQYAMILMDLEMPIMDGFEATVKIRAFEAENGRPRVPIVALTAHAIEEYRHRSVEAGMDDYATKPTPKQQVLDLASRWVDTRPQVLMVDDAEDGREIFRRFLEKEKRVRVLTAVDGFQALEMAEIHRVDAVVVDLEMPRMDGFTLIEKLRQNEDVQLPILALSGHTGLETRRRCEEAGCVGYLVKPAARKDIVETVYRVLFPHEYRSTYATTSLS